MFPGMGGQVQQVGDNQWAAMPFYQKVNHLAGYSMEMFDTIAPRWYMIVAAMLLLHKDPDPRGWLVSRLSLVIQTLQACIPMPTPLVQ